MNFTQYYMRNWTSASTSFGAKYAFNRINFIYDKFKDKIIKLFAFNSQILTNSNIYLTKLGTILQKKKTKSMLYFVSKINFFIKIFKQIFVKICKLINFSIITIDLEMHNVLNLIVQLAPKNPNTNEPRYHLHISLRLVNM